MVDDLDLVSVAQRCTQTTGFSGVVDVRRGDETIVMLAAGLADRGHGIANSTSTRFAIASGTKGFTALTVMSLVEDGTMGLDQRARELLGDDLRAIDDGVTVRQLLAHRSGIGDYLDEDAQSDINDYVMTAPVHELSSAEAYLTVLDGHPQVSPPGEVFRYNNGGYVILAILAERAAGRSYHALVEERVIRASGLSSTSFERNDELPGDVAVGYLAPDGLRSNVLHLPVLGVGDGGIVSTTGDLHRFWFALFRDRVVPAELRRAMLEPNGRHPDGEERYGLGFWLHPTGSAVILEGMDAGISFRSIHDPVSELTSTVVSNTSSGTWPVARTLEAALGLG